MNYKETYDSFWKDIVEIDGELDREQVMKELADYKVMLNEVPKVYEEVSGLTKPLTHSRHILSNFYDKYIGREVALNDIEDMVDENGMVDFKEIEKYLK